MMGHREKIRAGMETCALFKLNKNGYYPGIRKYYKNRFNRRSRHEKCFILSKALVEFSYLECQPSE